jgi:hypothetical protein
MKIVKLLDLEDVDPLFKVPSCVVTAQNGKPRYPVDAIVFEGTLSQKNSKLGEVTKLLLQTKKEFEYYEIGQRSFLESREFDKVLKAIEKGQRSVYYENFTNGATVYPRQFWLVEPVVHPKLGIDPTKPKLKTSQRAIDRAKAGYANVSLDGEVESRFLYHLITGSELAPFCIVTPPIVVLPIEPNGSKYRVVTEDEAKRKGYSGLKNWLLSADKIWVSKRGEKSGKADPYAWLNYQNKLTSQSSNAKFKVLYNASGTYLVSSVVENRPSTVRVDSSEIRISGVIADHKAYWFDTNNHDEAMFIAAILNAPIIDSLIKPMQSRGQWGERDIHKKVLELPIPKFNSKNKAHMALVDLAKQAQIKARKLMPPLEAKYSGIGKIRQLIKAELSEEILKIDKIVRDLIVQSGSLPNNLEDFLGQT